MAGFLDWWRDGKETVGVRGHSPRQVARTSGPGPTRDLRERFVDRGCLGDGASGEVRRVLDTNLSREVAMKVLAPELAGHPDHLANFLAEAQVTAQLDHPNVVPVHELGVDPTGATYFTMKLVRGETLSDRVAAAHRAGPPSTEQLLDLLDVFLKVCDAVAFAHSRGVLHRDLKPDNLMVGEYGQVYVMDWGLALLLGGGESGAAGEGRREIVGTPAFMPPEQAAGEVERLDCRADVFALGALLYFMLTRCEPYGDLDVEVALGRARRCAWIPVGELNPQAPAALCQIVERAMAPDPAARYPSVPELAGAVQGTQRAGLHLPRRTYPPGSRIVVEGEAGEEAYLILEGRCEVHRTTDGLRRSLRWIGPGEVFGETAIMAARPRTATVEAIDETTVLVVTRQALEQGLGLDRWLGSFARNVAARFHEAETEREALRLRCRRLEGEIEALRRPGGEGSEGRRDIENSDNGNRNP